MRLGDEGEGLAIQFLHKNGYQILEQNYKTPVGEIDIIASEAETLVFIEVKTRKSIEFGMPYEAVNREKRRKISNTALLYLKRFKEIPPCRFDVVSIYYENGGPELELIKDAFEV